jgi:hypothetical protein
MQYESLTPISPISPDEVELKRMKERLEEGNQSQA